jgi:organic radical activating enzyme
MVNLLITMRCNRACSYCFAKEKIRSYSDQQKNKDMTLPDLKKVIKFLGKGETDTIQLAGGEPTIHPEFDEILKTLLDSGFNLNVLSNALWDDSKNELFTKISPTKLGFLLNIDSRRTYSDKEWEKIERNLSALSERGNVTLSFNIFEKEPNYEYIFDLVTRKNIKNLRLSFSMPVMVGQTMNSHIPLKDYHEHAPMIMKFVERAEASDVCVKLDNTVPICMFTKEQMGELMLKEVLDPRRNFVCFPALDIGPDLSVWRCFGTANMFNKNMDDFHSFKEAFDFFNHAFDQFQHKVYPLAECTKCQYAKDKICQGGCIGFSISRIQELGITPRETEEDDILAMRLRTSAGVDVRQYDVPDKSFLLQLNNRYMLEVEPSVVPLLALADGKRTVRQVIDTMMSDSGILEEKNDPLDEFLAEETSRELVAMVRRLLEKGFLTEA